MADSDSPFPAEVDLGALGKTLLEAAQAGRIGVTVTLTEPGINIYVSDAAADILGRPKQEILRENPLAHVAPEDLPRLRERQAKRRAGEPGQITYDVTVLRKDGQRQPITMTATDATLDGKRAVVAFIFDAAPRHAAEESRRQAEERFRELIEAAPEPIGIFDKSHFIYANPAFVSVLGYDRADELYPVPLTELVDPSDALLLESRVQQIIDHRRQQPPYVYTCRRRDGTTRLLEISSVPCDYKGKRSILAMGRDVTERRMLEARLIQADRLAALGTLAAGVAHEINNPLAYLMLNLEWIARKLSEGGQARENMEALAEMLHEARRGAERVATIVRELRSFSRADDETRRAVDVASVVKAAIKIAGHEIRAKARISTAIEPAAPVWANDGRLEQVVLNLLLNAAQALPESRMDGNEIRVVVRPGTKDSTVLEVCDNGEGIPPAILPRIFDPFFTTKQPGIGTGLGLSICHGIVSALGGQITVDSVPGEGTTFHVVLPIARGTEHEAGSAASERPPPRPEARARVLIVDDEVQIASTLRELLIAEHDVVAATSAAEALRVLRTGADFDVVLCDLIMPGMDGITLFHTIRKERPGFEQRIVFTTGGAFTKGAAEFLASVENPHIEKPFSLSRIEGVVQDMLARRPR